MSDIDIELTKLDNGVDQEVLDHVLASKNARVTFDGRAVLTLLAIAAGNLGRAFVAEMYDETRRHWDVQVKFYSGVIYLLESKHVYARWGCFGPGATKTGSTVITKAQPFTMQDSLVLKAGADDIVLSFKQSFHHTNVDAVYHVRDGKAIPSPT